MPVAVAEVVRESTEGVKHSRSDFRNSTLRRGCADR